MAWETWGSLSQGFSVRSSDRHHLGGCQKCKLSSSIPELLGVSNFYHPSELSRGLESKQIAGLHPLLINRSGQGDCWFAFLKSSWVMLRLVVRSRELAWSIGVSGLKFAFSSQGQWVLQKAGSQSQGLPSPGTEKSSPTNHHELPRDKQVFAECSLHLEQINFEQWELED